MNWKKIAIMVVVVLLAVRFGGQIRDAVKDIPILKNIVGAA